MTQSTGPGRIRRYPEHALPAVHREARAHARVERVELRVVQHRVQVLAEVACHHLSQREIGVEAPGVEEKLAPAIRAAPDTDLARDRAAVQRQPVVGGAFPRDMEFFGGHDVTVTTFVTQG